MKKRKIKPLKLSFAIITLVIILLLFFFFKNNILEIIKLSGKPNGDQLVSEFIKKQGAFGYIIVSFVEALEMIVIILPAELIQTPTGLAFPPLIAILLLDIGVIIGASVIYLLVNTFKIVPESTKTRDLVIKQFEKYGKNKDRIIMYFLFMTPLIPFGAICYYFSNKKMEFKKYIFTVATGVLPSILTSILIGLGIKYTLTSTVPLYILILIIIGVMALLIFLAFLIIKKIIPSGTKNNPNSILFYPILNLFGLYVRKYAKCNFVYDDKYYEMLNIETPMLILTNHQSSNDVYTVLKFMQPLRAALVSNAYYSRLKPTRFVMKKLGFIPKKMFTGEITPVKQMIKYVKNGTSILMMPEARLSHDGTTNPLANGTINLIKTLKIPVVCITSKGNYLANSKYHKSSHKIPVEVKVNSITYPDEYNNYDNIKLYNLIFNSLNVNDFDYSKNLINKDKNVAKGYEYLIYKCPNCHKDYTTYVNKNMICCHNCDFTLEFDKHFQFKENKLGISNLHSAYQYIKNIEKDDLNDEKEIFYQDDVDVVKISLKGKKYDQKGYGKIYITKEGFKFIGTINNENVELFNHLENMQVLPYGVNDEYECYFNGELYYFYPQSNSKSVTKASLIYDLVYEKYNKNK